MWGEMVLESILNASGLRKGIEYTLQGGHVDEEGGRIIPDAIVNMPDNKKIIIDSKVTLLSYMEYCEADTDEARSVAAKALLTSIKKHIDTLSTKRYQDIDGAFEYVFMFVPLEGAYMTAIAEDKGLFEYALSKNVALTTASSLMTTLKTVYMIWRSERQNQNAALIAKEAGAVYDKMAGFLAEFEKINTNLKRASDSYENARKLLATGRGAALARLEKLKEMGAKTGKSIEEYIEFVDMESVEDENKVFKN
jgi:DNA recombination protein RmuC